MEWLLVALAIAVALPATAWLAQDRLVFFPQAAGSTARLPPDAGALEVIAADGTRLRGWIRAAARQPAPAVLYFGGNAEEVSWTLADHRWPRDWSVVALNYRGYGESEGRPGEAALVADAIAIRDALSARPDIDAARIVAVGRSLGAGVAVQLAAARPLSGVVLVSPFDSLVALGRTHFPWLPVSWLLRHRFDGMPVAAGAGIPMLAIVADRDSIVPVERSRALYDAWAGPKAWVTVPSSDHNTLERSPVYWSAIARFLDSSR